MPTLDLLGTPYAYDEAGEGSALLLLHAGIADRRMWDDAWPMLSAGHRAIRLDLRGYGDTPLPDGTFNWTADAAALLEALGVARAHVVGISMGAGIALDLALGRPDLVERLVLVAPGLSGWDYAPEMDRFDEEERAAVERGDLDAASWLNVRFWVDGPQRSESVVDATIRERVFAMQKLAYEVDNPTAELEWLVPDRGDRLGEVRARTLVVAGELDQPDFVTIGRHIADRIPDARYEVMPGVAHLPPMEAPEAFSRLVLDFLGE